MKIPIARKPRGARARGGSNVVHHPKEGTRQSVRSSVVVEARVQNVLLQYAYRLIATLHRRTTQTHPGETTLSGFFNPLSSRVKDQREIFGLNISILQL